MLVVALRAVGASNVVLGLAHVVLWRLLAWTRETKLLSPLTARVFAVHTFFVAFVVVLLGALAAIHAELLVAPSALGRLVCGATAVFWLLRLLAQPFVFDPVLLLESRWRVPLRLVASTYFAACVFVFAWAFENQP